MKKLVLLIGGIVALTMTPFASGHATVNLVGATSALTNARANYVVRVPNERANRSTLRVVLNVPESVQERISVQVLPGWNVRLVTRDTGQRDAEGAPILAVTQVIWSARAGTDVRPKMYAEFPIRIQNPATPQRMCFPIRQQYSARYNGRGMPTKGGAGENVDWYGDASSATPASCVNVVA